MKIPAIELSIQHNILIADNEYRVTEVVKDFQKMEIRFKTAPVKIPVGLVVFATVAHGLKFDEMVTVKNRE